MPDSALKEFEIRLLREGVASCHAKRASLELKEHLQDLRTYAVSEGMQESAAEKFATTELGNLDMIAADICRRTELKTWTYRYPKTARVMLPLAYVALLPATPLFAGIANAESIARWGACVMLSATITAAMLLAMQLSIALG